MIAWARYPYEGTTVLVTGGGSGIGRAIAGAFLEQGACVLVTGRNTDTLNETIATFQERAAVLVGDMATQDGVTAAIDHLISRWGHLDVVVANAGIATSGTIDDLDDAAWERMRSINLDGLIRWHGRACSGYAGRAELSWPFHRSRASAAIGIKPATTQQRVRSMLLCRVWHWIWGEREYA